MVTLKKWHVITLVVILLIGAGFFWYRHNKRKNIVEEIMTTPDFARLPADEKDVNRRLFMGTLTIRELQVILEGSKKGELKK